MSGLPSHIFVVRHGNRLDASDKQWHLTSPTPYDPPLTYGGFLQARQVGNHIASILETLKIEGEASNEDASPSRRRKRYKVVIHSSPFLRCVQTSVGISSGLAQAAPDSLYSPADVLVPAVASAGKSRQVKTAVLRLDSFLGEWLTPEYFEMITSPPGPALMLGGAKADLLRREDYSIYTDFGSHAHTTSTLSLWSNSPTPSPSDSEGNPGASAMGAVFQGQPEAKKGYAAPRPTYAVSTGGRIPDGFVAHARDACTAVDYQWDSMREPVNLGDGGKLGEEWTAMHKRFRRGLKKMLNWYATTDGAAELVTTPVMKRHDSPVEDDDVETVVIIVSHGAGCNALIGAITHQPVLMDVGIASLTMALRKPDVDYSALLQASQVAESSHPGVAVDKLYDIRLSASTEHLQPSSSTPVSARSSSTPNAWNLGARGRTATFGTPPPAAANNPFGYMDSLTSPGSRSTSASAALEISRRDTVSTRPSAKALAFATGSSGGSSNGSSSNASSTPGSLGLWAPVPSSLRLMDDGASDDDSDNFPNFDQSRFKDPLPENAPPPTSVPLSAVLESNPTFPPLSSIDPVPSSHEPEMQRPFKGPTLAGPIKLHTNLSPARPAEEVTVKPLGEGFGGLWSLPRPPGEAERFRDLSHTKRRWTVNERA